MFSPWSSLYDMRTEMNRLRDETNRLFNRWGVNGAPLAASTAYPPLNLWEDEEHLYLEAELPGLDLSDLEIYVTGENSLSIKGQRKQPETKGGAWHRQERGYGAFSRLVELPCAVDNDGVSAEFQNGVLTVTMPKREEVKPRKIAVKAN